MTISKIGALFLVLTAVVSMITFDVDPAAACSCPVAPTEALLNTIDAAFVGKATQFLGNVGDDEALIKFEVLEPAKGTFGDSAYLLVDRSDGGCGQGQFVPGGAMFNREAGVQLRDMTYPRVSEACTSLDPDLVRHGAPGLPAPDRTLPARAVAYGEHRGTGLRFIAESGLAVGYIAQQEPIIHARVCDDDETIALLYETASGPDLTWIDIQSLERVGELQLDLVIDATLRPEIRNCVAGQRVLVSNGDDLHIVDKPGEVAILAAGQAGSGSLSPDGSLFVRWIDAISFEFAELTDATLEFTTVVVTNHRGVDIAISPDNTHFAFARRQHQADGGRQEIVIADRAGLEQSVVLLEAEWFESGIEWIDEKTVVGGTNLVRIGGADLELRINRPTRADDHWSFSQVGSEIVVRGFAGSQLLQTATGHLVPLGDKPIVGRVLALGGPVELDEAGFTPDPVPSFPMPGPNVPSTGTELRALLEANPSKSDHLNVSQIGARGLLPPTWVTVVMGFVAASALLALYVERQRD